MSLVFHRLDPAKIRRDSSYMQPASTYAYRYYHIPYTNVYERTAANPLEYPLENTYKI